MTSQWLKWLSWLFEIMLYFTLTDIHLSMNVFINTLSFYIFTLMNKVFFALMSFVKSLKVPPWLHIPTHLLIVVFRGQLPEEGYIKGKENRKTIMSTLMIHTLYYWFMRMHRLKYLRFDRKDRLKNMYGTTLEVAMLAGPTVRFLVFTNVWLGPSDVSLHHSLWMFLTLIGQQNVNGVAFESWRYVAHYKLRCQFINNYDILYLF